MAKCLSCVRRIAFSFFSHDSDIFVSHSLATGKDAVAAFVEPGINSTGIFSSMTNSNLRLDRIEGDEFASLDHFAGVVESRFDRLGES